MPSPAFSAGTIAKLSTRNGARRFSSRTKITRSASSDLDKGLHLDVAGHSVFYLGSAACRGIRTEPQGAGSDVEGGRGGSREARRRRLRCRPEYHPSSRETHSPSLVKTMP